MTQSSNPLIGMKRSVILHLKSGLAFKIKYITSSNEIVRKNGLNYNDYKGVADKYIVPYASVYNWVKKYNEFDEDGPLDRWGRPFVVNPIKELTTEGKQAIEIGKLKKELERSKWLLKY